jgi:hypothetical protein
MDSNDIQEFRYSVTDVIFVDVGDVSVPSEHQALFDEYCSEVDSFPVRPLSKPLLQVIDPRNKVKS